MLIYFYLFFYSLGTLQSMILVLTFNTSIISIKSVKEK